MILSLLTGILLITAVFFIIRRISHYPSNIIGVIVAVLILIVIMPVAIIYWPGADVFAIHLAIYMITIFAITIIFSYREKNSTIHWAPVSIISFFVLLVLVDTFFVTLADKGISTVFSDLILPKSDGSNSATFNFPGKVVYDYYQKENLYNDYLENIEIRKLYNWNIKKGWLKLPIASETAIFKIHITDKNNISINTAKISGKFIRYSNSQLDTNFSMRFINDGIYHATIILPAAGRWGLVLKIQYQSNNFEIQASTTVLPQFREN